MFCFRRAAISKMQRLSDSLHVHGNHKELLTGRSRSPTPWSLYTPRSNHACHKDSLTAKGGQEATAGRRRKRWSS
eukprot:451460-Hanusia_phi.AAC.12